MNYSMMEVEAQKLTGKALQWAVASLEGRKPHITPLGNVAWWEPYGDRPKLIYAAYDTDWGLAGEIITREGIGLVEWPQSALEGELFWTAQRGERTRKEDGVEKWSRGPTALIAAMRCYVVNCGGESIVEVPYQLVIE